MLCAVTHADAFQGFRHPFLSFAGIHPAIGERQLNVLINGQVANQIETLKDESNFAIANARALRQRKVLDRLLVEYVFAVSRRIEQTENRQQGDRKEDTSELQSHSFISYAVFCLKV